MKVKLYSLITAIALMLIAPFAMAGGCGSCHDSPGAVYQVSAIDVGSVNALDAVGPGSGELIQNSGLFKSAIAYKSPKEHDIHRVPINDGKVNDNVLVTVYPGRNLYSGVTAA